MAVSDNVFVDAGATFVREYIYTNADGTVFDLTGFTAKAQVREDAAATLLFEVTPTITVLTGKVSMTWSATNTALMTKKLYNWALELTNAGTGVVIRLVQGTVTVSLEVVK